MKTDKKNAELENRRSFLTKAVVVSGGAAVAVAGTGVRAEQAETPLQDNDKPSSGYQETAHVLAYYKSLSA